MIKVDAGKGFKRTLKYLYRIATVDYKKVLDEFGKKGVEALRQNTPVDSEKTANSWKYEIEAKDDQYIIRFNNENVVDGCNIAIILQYGHATRNGGWVEGRDYINPALRPIFDGLTEQAWKEVIG